MATSKGAESMSDKGNYKYPAWCQMETALDQYGQDREAWLEREGGQLGPAGAQKLEACNQAAEALVTGVKDLSGTDAMADLKELAEASDFQQGKPFELLNEHFCISLGWEAMDMLSKARSRFLDLLLLLRERALCDEARAFLQRVARCYLFGFDAECVVMCRSVLDLELGNAVDRQAGKSLCEKIKAAYDVGMISDTECKTAHDVRCQGNKAVHEDPGCDDALTVVRSTVLVLDALKKSRRY